MKYLLSPSFHFHIPFFVNIYSNWIARKGCLLSCSTFQAIQGLLHVPQISPACDFPLASPSALLPGQLCRSQHHSSTAADVTGVSLSSSQSIAPSLLSKTPQSQYMRLRKWIQCRQGNLNLHSYCCSQSPLLISLHSNLPTDHLSLIVLPLGPM